MKKILSLGLLLWIGSLLSAQTLFAQASTYDLRFINPQIDCYNQQFCIDIQIRNAGTDLMAIGSYTIFFHYNFQSINIPVYTGTHFNDLETCVSGFSPYMANAFGADTLTGDANITTLMQYPNLGCPLIDNNWIQMGYLCFDIINPEQSTQLEFDHGLTLFNLNDNYPAHIQGSLTNFDMLPDCNLLDSDNDGLSDAQEIVLNTNPLSPDTDMDGLPDFDEVTTHQTDPTMADTDTDGLSDSQEIDLNTNPLSPDTDMDGLPDFDEVTTHQTNPTMADTDTDGLSDSQEIDLNTNPLSPDTDMDGLPDFDEVTTHQTNPTMADTDTDGLSDSQEIDLNTNPLSPDTDMDGLPDFDEVTTHQTNPTMADTDTDGLSDSQEIDLNTNPLSSDTDMDGLPDFDEVTTHQTNPTMADTDTDGLSDSQEIDLNTNPLLPDTDMDSLSDGIEAPGGGPIDTDNDTIIDALDSDDDNDGLPTILEDANQNGILLDDDSDQDGLPNYLDPDPVGVLLPTAAANAPTIYPNPTSDLLQIELPQQYWANYCAIIYNLAGQAAAIKPLITKNISADNHNLIAQISIADLPVGTYMLYLNDEKNKTFFVCKVIKK